jgi:hypothetical protein
VDQVPVSAFATDPYGDVTVQLAFGHDPSGDAPWFPAYGPLSTTVPFGTPDGAYEIRGRAKNVAGLVSEVASVTVKLDRTAPTVEILHPRPGDFFSQKGLGVLVSFSASDLNGISNVSYRVDGGGWLFIPSTARSVPVTLGGFGEHTVMVRVLDGAGNPGTGSSTFEVQRTEPRVASGSVVVLLLILILMLAILAVLVYRTRRGRAGKPATPSGPPQSAPPPEAGTSRATGSEPRPGAPTPEDHQGTGPTRKGWEEY